MEHILTETTVICSLERADLERAGEVLFGAFTTNAVSRGYAPALRSVQEGVSWAWALLRHEPAERLVAVQEDRVVGICCLTPRGLLGGIGPVAVDPECQGRGIGRKLLQAVLHKAGGCSSIRLFQEAFNPASFSLYYGEGFSSVADLLDLRADRGSRKRCEPCGQVSKATAADLNEIHAYDAPRSGADRRPDLGYLQQWGSIFIHRAEEKITGYLACLPGAASVQFGPLVADGEEEACRLFRHAADAYADRPVQTRVMSRDRELVHALREAGFTLTCIDLLMVRGSWRPGRSIEAFGRFPEGA